jgi:hypothetical protein
MRWHLVFDPEIARLTFATEPPSGGFFFAHAAPNMPRPMSCAICTHPNKPNCGFYREVPLMTFTQMAEGAQRTASTVMYGGAGMSAGSGASVAVSELLGLTMTEWQIVGILGGLFIGFTGLIVNSIISVYFKSKHLRLAETLAKPNLEE